MQVRERNAMSLACPHPTAARTVPTARRTAPPLNTHAEPADAPRAQVQVGRAPGRTGWYGSPSDGLDDVVEGLHVAQEVVGVPGGDGLAAAGLDRRPAGRGRREEGSPLGQLGSDPRQDLPDAARTAPGSWPAPDREHRGRGAERGQVRRDVPLAAGPGGAGLQQPRPGPLEKHPCRHGDGWTFQCRRRHVGLLAGGP